MLVRSSSHGHPGQALGMRTAEVDQGFPHPHFMVGVATADKLKERTMQNCFGCDGPPKENPIYAGKLCEFCYAQAFPEQYKEKKWKQTLDSITPQAVAEAVVSAVTSAEEQYGKRLFYAQDKNPNSKGEAPGFNVRGVMKFEYKASELTPAAALQQFFEGPTICECHSLLLAVYHLAILRLIGAQAFNVVFDKMVIESAMTYFPTSNPIGSFLKTRKINNEGNIKIGDWVYYANRADYKTVHPAGAAGGWNILCIDNGKFIGFGLSDVGKSEVSLKELYDIMVDYYEQPETPEDAKLKKLIKNSNADLNDFTRAAMKAGASKGENADEPHLQTSQGAKYLSQAALKAIKLP